MAFDSADELRNLTDQELVSEIKAVSSKLLGLRTQKAINHGEAAKPHQFKHLRHRRAQLLTIQTERRSGLDRGPRRKFKDIDKTDKKEPQYINVRLTSLDGIDIDTTNIVPSGKYILRVGVGDRMETNLPVNISARRFTEAEIGDGVDADWVITSSDAELSHYTDSSTASISKFVLGEEEDSILWVAKFSLRIPGHGKSKIVQLQVRPLVENELHFNIIIYVNGSLFRHIEIDIDSKDELAESKPEQVSIEC